MRIVLGSLVALSAGLALSVIAAPPGVPQSPKNPVQDTLQGQTITDEYRWLEDWNDAKVKSWSDAQNAYARAMLDKLPNVEGIRARVTEIMSAKSVRYGGLAYKGGKYFASKFEPPKQQPFVVVMDSLEHPEAAKVVVDPNALNAKGTTSFDWFVPSPDGKLVAVSLSEGGSESGDAVVFDVATGKEVGKRVARVNGGTAGGSLAWAPDSKGYYYTRYPRAGERAAEDMEFYTQVYFHDLNGDEAKDRYEVGKDFPRIAEIILDSDEQGRVIASMQKGDGGEYQHYLRGTDGKWQQLDKYEDRIVQANFGAGDAKGGTLLLISRKGAERGQLQTLAYEDGKPLSLASAKTIVPEGKDTLVSDFIDFHVLQQIDGKIYAEYQLGGPSEIRAFNLDGSAAKAPQQLPVASVAGLTKLGEGRVAFNIVSYVDPASWKVFDPKSGATTTLASLTTPPPVDYSDCEVVREFATSKDGTKVPVNIVRRKGTKLDGNNPVLVTAYGGYGVNMSPSFSPVRHVLLEQGVVWVQANIRGGGEYGDAWHKAGNLLNKQNVFDDFAAACEHMVKTKYTNPSKLAIEGGSNGGLLMGAAFTQHPDLFKAVVSHVGIYDMLRVELSSNGAFNVTEFGTVKDPAQFKALYAYSPYHHVKEGTKYPSILFLTGANDPRVDPMQSRKMTAKLQSVGADVYLRTSANSGHGIGTGLAERIEQSVDVDAFVFDRLGVTFSPGHQGETHK
jgi:prolyl oligopeptidase